MEKQCTKCNVVKSINEFYPDLRNTDGKQSQCRECQNKDKSKWRQNNTDYMKKYNRQYQKERRANDINFRLAKNLRCRLRKALLNQLTSKK